jgi:aquaporin Z
MEAAALGVFMVSACGFGALLWHPDSPARDLVADGVGQRALMGLAMGLTAVGIIYSPWGKQSGAHMNPSVTLTFWRLGKVKPWDAVFYVMAQFAGGLAGVLLARLALGDTLAHPAVHYVVTHPGSQGVGAAFLAEVAIAFVLMMTILIVSNSSIGRWTGLFAGALVASYITFEDPISGMSMNPARSLASALPAMDFSALWIYFTAPPLGMLLAAQAYTSIRSARAVRCAKLHHENDKRCIFCQATPAMGQA